ncbi:MAG: hypothetical protein WKF78_00290 [Candidatus Limnocylindrales bacterium]
MTRVSTVDGIVRRSARRHPDRTALRFADRIWTYRQAGRGGHPVGRRAARHGTGQGRPGGGVREELRRLPAGLPRLRPRAGWCTCRSTTR